MIRLFLDIETLPGDESAMGEIEAEITPPGNLSRPETIRQWERDRKPLEVQKRFRATALRGHSGRILCIGYIKEDPRGGGEGVLTGEEPVILRAFWDLAEDVDTFVGFNILEFDLKYIWQRSVVHGVPPSRGIALARYRSDQVYDVMREWEQWGRDSISLDALTRALGVPSPKGQMHGSEVYDYYQAGRLQEIYDYCLADVAATRAVYMRMNFLE